MLKILKSIIFNLSTKNINFLRKDFFLLGSFFLHRGSLFLHRAHFFLRTTVAMELALGIIIKMRKIKIAVLIDYKLSNISKENEVI